MTKDNANPVAKCAALIAVATTLSIATVAACTPTPAPAPTITIAPTWTPVPTWTPSPEPSWTPVVVVRVVTAAASPTNTPSETPRTAPTPARVIANTATPSPTVAPTATSTSTSTPTASPTPSPTPTATPANTAKATATQTDAPTSTPTPTRTTAPIPTPIPADAPEDLAPLIALYNATNGPNWRNNDNWLSDRPLYDWFGLKVNLEGRVTEINLDYNRLNGTLPPEIGDLDQLRQLNISASGLTGAIPREIGRLTRLEYIYLESNDLTGPIPHELGLLPKLRKINFNQNGLSGELPPSLLSSESIETIFMRENNLTGPIPREFHARSQIAFLRLSSNQLDSEIPPNIGQLQNLQELWIHDNQLTGEIPTSIGQLRDLIHLIASDNQLSGPIPDEVSELSRLILLILDNNQLTGPIPQGLGDIKTLKRLEIAGNDFTGCIPDNLRGVEESNINFANIPVCGEPDRSEPSIPTYIQMEFGDAASAAETLAAQLAVQEVSNLLTDIGWPTPEETITVYVADEQGLALYYSNHVEGCDLACASSTIDDRHATAELGAAFVRFYGTEVNSLEWLAGTTARLVLSAILLEPSGGLRSQDLHRDHEWLTEGLTTLISLLATAEAMGKPLDDLRSSNADSANRQFEPLWDLESDRSTYNYRLGARHPVGAAAVDLLASQVGLRKLTEFFATRNSNEDWRETFQRIFNISVPDFYELFNQHHLDGFPLRNLPLVGDTDWQSSS